MSTFAARNIHVTIQIDSGSETAAKKGVEMIHKFPLTFSGINGVHREASPLTRCEARGKCIEADCKYADWDIGEVLIKKGLKAKLKSLSTGATVTVASTDVSERICLARYSFTRFFSIEDAGFIKENYVWYKPESFVNRHHYTIKMEEERILPSSQLREAFNDAFKSKHRLVVGKLMREFGFDKITLNNETCDKILNYGGSIKQASQALPVATTNSLFEKYASIFKIGDTALKCIKRAAKEDDNIVYQDEEDELNYSQKHLGI